MLDFTKSPFKDLLPVNVKADSVSVLFAKANSSLEDVPADLKNASSFIGVAHTDGQSLVFVCTFNRQP